MKYMRKKLFRELWEMKFRAVLVILSIGMAIGLYGGLLLVEDNVFASRDLTLADLKYEDARFSTFGMANTSIVADINSNVDNIKTIDQRIALDTIVSYNDEEFSGLIYGIDSSRRPLINNLLIDNGTYFNSDSSGEVIIELRFAEANDINIGDNITLNYGSYKIQRTVVGVAFSPEYKYVINPNTGFAEKGYFSPVWMPIDEIYDMLGMNDVLNEVLIQVVDNGKLDETITKVQDYLANNGIRSLAIKGVDELDSAFMEEDVSSLGEFSVAIGVIILLVAIFVIYDALTKIITSQRTLIGIMRALGANSKELLQHYVSFGVILSVIGIIIGLPLGYFFMYLITGEFAKLIGLTFIATNFNIHPFYTPMILTMVVTILSSIFAVIKIIKISPVEAMTNQTIKKDFTKSYPSEKLFDLLSGKRKYSTKIPVRQVLRRKRRSIMTALTVAVTALLVLASIGFMNSFFYQLDNYYVDNVQYQLEGRLDQPYIIDDFNQDLQNIAHIRWFEGMISQSIMASSAKDNITTTFNAFRIDTKLRVFNFEAGKFEEGKVVLGRIIAKDLGLTIGDSVKLFSQAYNDSTYVEKSYEISGILSEFMDSLVFMTLPTAQLELGMGEKVNSIAIQSEGNIKEIKKDLINSSIPFSGILDTEQSKNSFVTLLEGMMGMVASIVIIGILILILFSLNIVVLDVMEREREFVNLRTSGAQTGTISKVIGLQIFLITLLVFVFDIILTPQVITYLIDATFASLATISTYIEPVSYLIGAISVVIGLGFGVVSSIRRTMRISLLVATRLRFRN